jgi:hypothetical protein
VDIVYILLLVCNHRLLALYTHVTEWFSPDCHDCIGQSTLLGLSEDCAGNFLRNQSVVRKSGEIPTPDHEESSLRIPVPSVAGPGISQRVNAEVPSEDPEEVNPYL